jgi:uncharacterized phage infection (PIP) family protein YhgE
MKSNAMRFELLVASALPVVAVLVVGVTATKQMTGLDSHSLLSVMIISAVCAFFGELYLTRLMQHLTRKQYDELVAVCQAYVAGDRTRRPIIHGDNALRELASALNAVLDAASKAPPLAADSYASREMLELNRQVQKLVQDMTPVTEGDLRVKAEVFPGNIGAIANICNSFVEALVDLIRWTRYSAEQTISRTNNLLENAIELAQTAEAQMLRFSQTTEAVERLLAFIQSLNGTLRVSSEVVQEMQTCVQQLDAAQLPDTARERLNASIQRQSELLQEALQATQTNASLAESMVSGLYVFAKRIHQSSTGILKTAEQLNALSSLAEQWHQSVSALRLPEIQNRTAPRSQAPGKSSIAPGSAPPSKGVQKG